VSIFRDRGGGDTARSEVQAAQQKRRGQRRYVAFVFQYLSELRGGRKREERDRAGVDKRGFKREVQNKQGVPLGNDQIKPRVSSLPWEKPAKSQDLREKRRRGRRIWGTGRDLT